MSESYDKLKAQKDKIVQRQQSRGDCLWVAIEFFCDKFQDALDGGFIQDHYKEFSAMVDKCKSKKT